MICKMGAQRELGWKHHSVEEMWSELLEGEIALLARRKGQSLIQRLKPLETVDDGIHIYPAQRE
jgi:hypothetical protein